MAMIRLVAWVIDTITRSTSQLHLHTFRLRHSAAIDSSVFTYHYRDTVPVQLAGKFHAVGHLSVDECKNAKQNLEKNSNFRFTNPNRIGIYEPQVPTFPYLDENTVWEWVNGKQHRHTVTRTRANVHTNLRCIFSHQQQQEKCQYACGASLSIYFNWEFARVHVTVVVVVGRQ